MSSLEEQLGQVFSRGLGASTQEERASLVEALSSLGGLSNGKETKSEANYRMSDGKESCGNCAHYSDGKCDVVSGHVEADHVSDLYEPEKDNGKK